MAYTTCVQEMKGWENSPHGSFSAHTPNINPFAENKTKKNQPQSYQFNKQIGPNNFHETNTTAQLICDPQGTQNTQKRVFSFFLKINY